MADLRPVECGECEGGIVERIVGTIQSPGLGGPYEPDIREYECEECVGEGMKGCAYCGATPAYIFEPTAEPLCEPCNAIDE
jgi:hypothetical protein